MQRGCSVRPSADARAPGTLAGLQDSGRANTAAHLRDQPRSPSHAASVPRRRAIGAFTPTVLLGRVAPLSAAICKQLVRLSSCALAEPCQHADLGTAPKLPAPSDIGVHKRQKTVIRAPLRDEQLTRAKSRIERLPGPQQSKPHALRRIPPRHRSIRCRPASHWPRDGDAGWSSPVARQAHNLKVVGSNPTPATSFSSFRSVAY